MTPEPPRSARRNRPDADFRRRALAVSSRAAEPAGRGPGDAGPSGNGSSTEPPRRESFRDALSRIPDLGDADARWDTGRSGRQLAHEWGRPSPPSASPSVAPTPSAPGAPPLRATAAATSAPIADPPLDPHGLGPGRPAPMLVPGARTVRPPVADPDPPAAPGVVDWLIPAETRPRARRRPPTWRRAAFAACLLGLVISIPVLANTGYRLVTESTDGRLGTSRADPSKPGYEELVTSTPTAMVVQTSAAGDLVGLTLLALGEQSGGGAVVFVPVDTLMAKPAKGIDRLSAAYRLLRAQPDLAARLVADEVGKTLNVGIDEVFQLDDRGWSSLVAPVAPFEVDNLDTMDVAGFPLDAGMVSLGADLVGPYLGTLQAGEDELSRIARHEEVWRGWMKAVGASALQDAVPGRSKKGLSLFARTLAEGPVNYAPLPVSPLPGPVPRYRPEKDQIESLVADTVPVPDPASPGSRKTVRVLNGVAPEAIPAELTRKVASLRASVTVVGNGPSFGRDKTTIVYATAASRTYAESLKVALGATGSVSLDPAAPDNIDITVVFGRDVLDEITTTTTTTTAPRGATTTTALLGATTASDPTTPGGT